MTYNYLMTIYSCLKDLINLIKFSGVTQIAFDYIINYYPVPLRWGWVPFWVCFRFFTTAEIYILFYGSVDQ